MQDDVEDLAAFLRASNLSSVRVYGRISFYRTPEIHRLFETEDLLILTLVQRSKWVPDGGRSEEIIPRASRLNSFALHSV